MAIVAPDCSIATPITVPNRINNPIFLLYLQNLFGLILKIQLDVIPEEMPKAMLLKIKPKTDVVLLLKFLGQSIK